MHTKTIKTKIFKTKQCIKASAMILHRIIQGSDCFVQIGQSHSEYIASDLSNFIWWREWPRSLLWCTLLQPGGGLHRCVR